MARLYRGRIPTDPKWNLLDAELKSDGNKIYHVYSKDCENKEGEFNGFFYLKLVLSPGQKAKKANFWFSVEEAKKRLIYSKDTGIMKEHYETLYNSFMEYFNTKLF